MPWLFLWTGQPEYYEAFLASHTCTLAYFSAMCSQLLESQTAMAEG